MRTRWSVLSLVVLAAVAPRVLAQPASVQAQSLFDEGRKLVEAGKIAEGCAAFESSQKLDPAVTTLLNLADCREQNHQLATAWGAFVEANRMARASNNDKLARVAGNHAHKLEPRLSKLTISIPADRQVPGLEILRDKDLVHPASWNHALPIDGGTYTITARAPGHAPWSTTRTIKVESDAQAVDIPKLAEAKPGAPVAAVRAGTPVGPVAPPPPVKPAPPVATAPPVKAAPTVVASTGKPAEPVPTVSPPRPAAPPVATGIGKSAEATPAASSVQAHGTDGDDPPTAGRSRRLPVALGAGALVLGGATLGFHLWGNHIYDQAKQETSSQAARDELYHSANARRYVAQGLGVAALGCAGAAAYLYVRSRGEDRAETTVMTPVASPRFAGLAVVGRW